jgi:hypothetical protein
MLNDDTAHLLFAWFFYLLSLAIWLTFDLWRLSGKEPSRPSARIEPRIEPPV